eukprot:1997350-Amphidinium_carterae.1
MPTFVEPRAFRTSQEMFDYVGDNYQGGTKIYLCGSDTLKQADLTIVVHRRKPGDHGDKGPR